MISPLQAAIAHIIGPWLIGAVTSVGLLGVATLQCWMYYSTFQRDPVWLKLLVALIWCLECARMVFCMHSAYFYAILHWGDPSVGLSPIWSMTIMVPLTAIVGLLVHLFFARQVKSVTRVKYRILYFIIIAFSLGDFGLGVAAYVTAVIDGTFKGIVSGTPSHIATVGLGCAIVTDWTITASLVSFLRKRKTTKTRTLMQILILYSINFGLLISTTDLVVLIISNVKWSSTNLYQVSLFEVIGALYANTMLAALNSRSLVAEHLYTPENLYFTSINAVGISGLSISDMENHRPTSASLSIHVQVQTQTMDLEQGATIMDYGSSEHSDECEGQCHKSNKVSGGY